MSSKLALHKELRCSWDALQSRNIVFSRRMPIRMASTWIFSALFVHKIIPIVLILIGFCVLGLYLEKCTKCCCWQLLVAAIWVQLKTLRAPICNKGELVLIYIGGEWRWFRLGVLMYTMDYHFNFTSFVLVLQTVNILFSAFQPCLLVCVFLYQFYYFFILNIGKCFGPLFSLAFHSDTNCHLLLNWLSHSWAIFIYLNKC